MEIVQVVHHVGLHKYSHLLQVTIGKVARCVFDSHHALLNVSWEDCTPHDGVFPFSKEHSPHACLGGIHCDHRGVIRHYLSKASWSLCHAVGEHLEICQVIT